MTGVILLDAGTAVVVTAINAFAVWWLTKFDN